MTKFIQAIIATILLFILDQIIKLEFVNGLRWESECITLSLVYNYGVAFSMLEFLQGNLKYIQLVLLGIGAFYLFLRNDIFLKYYIALAFLYAGGLSNVYDRFIHGGVVDYVYWHCGFDFAVFNLADVLIDIAIVIIFYIQLVDIKKQKRDRKRYNFD